MKAPDCRPDSIYEHLTELIESPINLFFLGSIFRCENPITITTIP